jgi:hypothetical protein
MQVISAVRDVFVSIRFSVIFVFPFIKNHTIFLDIGHVSNVTLKPNRDANASRFLDTAALNGGLYSYATASAACGAWQSHFFEGIATSPFDFVALRSGLRNDT